MGFGFVAVCSCISVYETQFWKTSMLQARRSREKDFKVTIWGTRGTHMSVDPSNMKFGSDTICVEVRCGQRVLVFDAGSGFIKFGHELMARKSSRKFDLFFSHAHYDHVEGIPFFQPFYEKDCSCTIWSGRLKGIQHTREIFDNLMREPYFPIKIEKFQAKLKFRAIGDQETIELGDGIVVYTMRLHHPGGATGYRVEFDGKSFGFITDTTHTPNQSDTELVAFLNDIDLFVYDCGYTDEEFPKFAAFGHSTWQEALRIKKLANASAVLGFHHMPHRTDKQLDQFDKEMKNAGKACGMAKDGMIVQL